MATDRHLRDFFADLPDPRVTGRCTHDLTDVVLIVLCGTLAGADDFVSIAEFAEAKEGWLRDRLGLTLAHGVPSHDTLTRVFAALRSDAFHEAFLAWVAVASLRINAGTSSEVSPATVAASRTFGPHASVTSTIDRSSRPAGAFAATSALTRWRSSGMA